MLNRLTLYWQQHSRREQLLLAAGLTILILTLLWYTLVSPILTYHTTQQQLADKAVADLLWINQQKSKIQILRTQQPAKSGSTFAPEQIIKQSAQSYNIPLVNLKVHAQLADLTIEPLSFTTLLTWLQSLEHDYAIQVQSIELIQQLPRNGQVTLVKLSLNWPNSGN